jgi:hypothetical protein
MNYDVDYTDIIKAYQYRTTEFLNQLITAEAKLNASAAFILKLKGRIDELEKENSKLKSKNTRNKKVDKEVELQGDAVIDYN